MKPPRNSIAGLMAVVVLVAVGFAALKNPSEIWASCLFSLTVGLLLLALLGVAFGSGDRRMFWAGFSVFGWGYLILALLTHAFEASLPTTLLIQDLHQRWNGTHALIASLNGTDSHDMDAAFFQSGRSLATLLVALLGTVLVRVFASQHDDTHAIASPQKPV